MRSLTISALFGTVTQAELMMNVNEMVQNVEIWNVVILKQNGKKKSAISMIRKVMNQSNNVKLVNQVKKNGVINVET